MFRKFSKICTKSWGRGRERDIDGYLSTQTTKLIPEIELRASVRSIMQIPSFSLGAVCDEMIACVCECISCSGCNCEWSVARKTTGRSVHPLGTFRSTSRVTHRAYHDAPRLHLHSKRDLRGLHRTRFTSIADKKSSTIPV